MTKHLSTLLASMAVITLTANAQVTPPKEVAEKAVPEKSKTIKKDLPATPAASATVREGAPATPPKLRTATEVRPAVPGKSTTTTEVAPAGSARSTTTIEGAPAAPARSRTTTTEVAPAVGVTSTTVTRATTTTTATQRLDPVVARRHLSVAPQTVTITPEQRTALDRTVTIETRTAPVRRVYNVERNVVIVEEQGRSLALPYVTVPVLFVVDTAELLDAESRNALTQTAAVINGVVQTDPNARFDIEGHTSTEGTDEHNLKLSAERATRVFAELTQNYGVPPTALTAHGYGENFPMFPGGTEPELQADRRVLVVRTR